MTHLIIAVAVLAFAEVITLTVFGKRARKKEEPIKPNHSGWEVRAVAYNRMHGLPDDAI
ncbi:hypothetical protein [Streptococcus sp.]|uniref:hypothetical protein n=1 Tax=Streptococcus sp. TaxID=1306 RepID=UPI00208F1C2E|nr:hypothetical protein [Streptococcus sp.]MCO4545431.1 hypothetical protein [Streptococcus infantarius subsp. infantarius]MCO4548593.1 hypothetical protein [Streptococcus infantarius subsp. infantarius]MCO4570071.1 hypothetical protein [Streptococcus infantarius subsp. infantarius]MCO4588791.1 hypothetical protein [Streptococcus infantarius subsp. infantarius]MCO4623259.1 hypothetical protein [Streptococcus infantarius subsp. infantarius]